MAVFIMDVPIPTGVVSLMLASTDDELHYAANAIGIPRSRCQHVGSPMIAYRLTDGNKDAAIRNGARVIDRQQADNLFRLKLKDRPRSNAIGGGRIVRPR
jgi:hypothetical protein